MPPVVPDAAQLSRVIAQVTAPAFLLSAVASLLSVLMTRLSRIVDRSRSISELSIQDARRASREAELPVLRRRGWLIHRAIFWSAGAGIVTCLLIIAAFAAALLEVGHERMAAVLFILSMGFFTTSLIYLAREIRLSASEVANLDQACPNPLSGAIDANDK
jgi:hypothetical protein